MILVNVTRLSGCVLSHQEDDETKGIPVFTWEVLSPRVTKALRAQATPVTGWDPKSPRSDIWRPAAELTED